MADGPLSPQSGVYRASSTSARFGIWRPIREDGGCVSVARCGFFYGKTVLQDEVAEGSPYPAVRIASRDTPPVSHHKRLTSDSPIDRKEHTPKKKMGDILAV